MNISPTAKRHLLLGTGALALAVLIGAFGAHGLKNMVTPERLVTFETGVRYHFYHGFALVLLGLIQLHFPLGKASLPGAAFLTGILLFSFNCYLYVLTEMKVFAMIVPVGGLCFVLGWLAFFWMIKKSN